MDKIEKIVKKKIYLLPILKQIQKQHGFLSYESLRELAIITKMPLAKIYSSASFYPGLYLEKKGKNIIEICNSPSCYLNNSIDVIREAEKILKIKSGETTKNKKFSLIIFSCIACCDKAPAMRINGRLFGKLTKEKVKSILCRY